MMARSSDRDRRSLVLESPVASWTRGVSRTPTGARGGNARSTLVRFLLLEAPTPAAQVCGGDEMEVMHNGVAGLDVHKETVVCQQERGLECNEVNAAVCQGTNFDLRLESPGPTISPAIA
jgi:hypothetical protein